MTAAILTIACLGFAAWVVYSLVFRAAWLLFTNCAGGAYIVTMKYAYVDDGDIQFTNRRCVRAWSAHGAYVQFVKGIPNFDDIRIASISVQEIDG